jgi:hypothetical protein
MWAAVAALVFAYWLSARVSLPWIAPGPLRGSLVHPAFGMWELAELAGLVWLCGALVSRLAGLRPPWRAVALGAGLALVAAGAFLAEARLQHHGLVAERVIASRYGPPWRVFATAAAVAGAGAWLSWRATPRSPRQRRRRSRRRLRKPQKPLNT